MSGKQRPFGLKYDIGGMWGPDFKYLSTTSFWYEGRGNTFLNSPPLISWPYSPGKVKGSFKRVVTYGVEDGYSGRNYEFLQSAPSSPLANKNVSPLTPAFWNSTLILFMYDTSYKSS